MQKQLFSNLPEGLRKQSLIDNADRIEEVGYTRFFEPEEMLVLKDDLSDLSININDIEEAKKEANAVFAAELKPLKEQRKTILANLRAKSDYVKETCYAFFAPSERRVGFYNAAGQLVDDRPMRPGEFQKTIFDVHRNTDLDPSNLTGTND